jgi:heptosyltransferase-2
MASGAHASIGSAPDEAPLRALVVRAPNWIGDAVMSLGALREIRRIAGTARLAVAARPWVAGIFEESGLVDEIVPIEGRSWRDAVGLAAELRERSFDAAVLLQNAFEAALVARLARIPRVVGYPTDGRRFLLTDRLALAPDAAREHQSRYYMRIAAGFERAIAGTSRVDVERPDCSLRARDATRARGRELLAAHGVSPATPVVVLNPGATNSRAKQWLPERFAAVGDALADRTGARVAIVGSEKEAETAHAVAAAMRNAPRSAPRNAPRDRSRAVVLAGETSVAELVGVLASAVALVSNDTGPAHLGAALGVPTVTIFGPTEQFATHPMGARATIAHHAVDCAPCMLRDCPIDHRCMTGLGVDDVLRAVESVATIEEER